ncbi:MAG: hypothetical protein PHY28_01655 [Dehalococcoidales bacterium]|nr:hypothetical protein [Dehalococcoidales bacterium]
MRKQHIRLFLLITSLILTLSVTGGLFVYGYSVSSTSLVVTTTGADFAEVTVDNSSSPTWNVLGNYFGTTSSGTLFEVNTIPGNYVGDFIVTVNLINAAEMNEVYRTMFLRIEAQYRRGNIIDINGDSVGDEKDYVVLSPDNSEISIRITQTIPDRYKIRLAGGWYKSNPHDDSWPAGYEMPALHCEVSQR